MKVFTERNAVKTLFCLCCMVAWATATAQQPRRFDIPRTETGREPNPAIYSAPSPAHAGGVAPALNQEAIGAVQQSSGRELQTSAILSPLASQNGPAFSQQLPSASSPAPSFVGVTSGASDFNDEYGLGLAPAKPPAVSYSKGELTVVTDNSSLAEILTAIAKITGTVLEGSRPDSERFFGTFGPGTPREVLQSVLSGTRFDYVLSGTLDNPSQLQRIWLSDRESHSQHSTSEPR